VTLEACEQACLARAECGAIEYIAREWRCELHPPEDAFQTNDDANCQCFFLDRFPTSTPAPVTPAPTDAVANDFVEITPQGCCRNSEGNRNTLLYGHIFGTSLENCQQACVNRLDCGAVEFIAHQQRCELHPPEDAFQTNGDTNCQCFQLNRAPTSPPPPTPTPAPAVPTPAPTSPTPAPVTPTTPSPVTAVFAEVTPQGCCRNSEGNSDTLPLGHIFGTSLAFCQQACVNRPECGAVEFIAHQQRCELHPPEDGFQTNGDTNCQCFELDRTGSITTTAAPGSSPSFLEVSPQGCCRDSSGSSSTFAIVSASLEGCKQACIAEAECGAIEHIASSNKCELHPAEDASQTNGNSLCRCFGLQRSPAPPETQQDGPSFAQVTPQGCCRNSQMRSVTLRSGNIFRTTLEFCEQQCIARPECGAIEFIARQRRCELHPSEDAFQTNGNTNCQCFQLNRP